MPYSRTAYSNRDTGQEVEDYDRATEFEALGGRLIELAPAEWQGLAPAA